MQQVFALWAEVETPRSLTLEPFVEKVAGLNDGVDAVHLLQGDGGLNNVVVALKLKDRGLQPVVQLHCRDKNRLAIFSDLATLGALGLYRMTLATGHHPLRSDVPAAQPVYDLDVVQTLQLIRDLAQGKDLAGKGLATSPPLSVGVVTNIKGDVNLELLSVGKKIALGASFLVLIATEDLAKVRNFISQVRVPVIASVSLGDRSAADLAGLARAIQQAGGHGLNVVVAPGQETEAAKVLSLVKGGRI